MTKDEALALALEALENSVDLVREDAYNAEKLYGNYPSRQGKVAGLKVLADDHEKAITAIKQARALDKKAENARELGLNYEPDYKVTVVDNQHPNGVPLEQWGRVAEQGEERMKKLIKDLISAMEYHVEQTRPIHSTTVALQAAREAIRAQPAPVQEPVAYWIPKAKQFCIADPSGRPFAKAWEPLYTTPPAQQAPVQEPVRICDYVWPQRDEHKEECVYACNYTPGHHLARGELLAVVHPSQLISTYLQRDNEAAHGIASPEAQRQWVGLDAEDRWEIIYATERDERTTVMELVEAKLKEKNNG
jgi:hypothetical protein